MGEDNDSASANGSGGGCSSGGEEPVTSTSNMTSTSYSNILTNPNSVPIKGAWTREVSQCKPSTML